MTENKKRNNMIVHVKFFRNSVTQQWRRCACICYIAYRIYCLRSHYLWY